jgi:TPR repeat protein
MNKSYYNKEFNSSGNKDNKNNKDNKKQDKIAIIIPFRDLHVEQKRSEHLKKMIADIPEFFNKTNKPYTIYCIEQSNDNRKFNRGKLLNIGFEIANSEGCNIFVFHDIDLIPSNELIEYYTTVPYCPIHIGNVWKDKYTYGSFFGAVTAFSYDDYVKVNGYPNTFWGWGGEDDELYKRVKTNNLEIIQVEKGSYIDLEQMDLKQKLMYLANNKQQQCPYKWELLSEHEKTWRKNGLSNLKYNLIKRLKLPIIQSKNKLGEAIKITVDVQLNGHYSDKWCKLDYLPTYNKDRKLKQSLNMSKYLLNSHKTIKTIKNVIKKNNLKSFKKLKDYKLSSNKGNSDALFNIGLIYKKGQGVKQNFLFAIKYFLLAAEKGHSDAENNIGMCYYYGQGVNQDYTMAVKYYQLSADKDNKEAQYNLGNCYDKGQGVNKDYIMAAKYYYLAAKQGQLEAQYKLGIYYEMGKGIKKNIIKSENYLKIAAIKGNRQAQINLINKHIIIINTTNINLYIALKLSNTISVYNDNLNGGNYYSNYLKTTYKINEIEDTKGDIVIYNFNKSLYNFFLILPNELMYFFLNQPIKNINVLPKYKSISSKFYHYNEIFIKYNLFNDINTNTKILCIGGITPIEVIKYKKYKCNYIKFINFYKLLDSHIQLVNNIKSIYDIKLNDNITYEHIYLLPNLYPELYNTFNLNIYSITKIDKIFSYLDIFYNVINIFIGALVGLKYTALNGTFILNLSDVSQKSNADIYLILKKYFKESYLYYPEICNMVKLSGVVGIFKGFNGIPNDELTHLETILEQLKKEYPNNMSENFNIYDPEIRKQFNITKPIEPLDKRYRYIDGFLNIPKKSKLYNDTYKEVIDFNNLLYINRLSYVKKLLYLYENNIITKVPSQTQITSAIIYCKKYDIPIFNKYTNQIQESSISKSILYDLYGLHEPILSKFITPFQNNIINKIIFNPKYTSKHSKDSKHSKYKHNSRISLLKTIKTSSIKNKLSKKINHLFLNNLFINNNNTNTNTNTNTNNNVSLENVITQLNNSLSQVEYLMDARIPNFINISKDISKENKINIFKEQLEFHKEEETIHSKKNNNNENHIDNHNDNHNYTNLDIQVQNLLNDTNISYDWLKLYEIISQCKLIPTNQKGTYKSFNMSDTPETGMNTINCINYYIHTKTQYNDFEWKSQCLKENSNNETKNKTINKTINKTLNVTDNGLGVMEKHSEIWDFGVDDTGDITNIENIKHYAKIAKDMNINLMISDYKINMNEPNYYHVAYASYVAILYALPLNGTLLYKIICPIDIPLIWNLIYITYTNFKEMYFYKPIHNIHSREFYIIGKGYLGTEQNVLDKLLSLVDKFSMKNKTFNKEEFALFADKYPEEFVIQVLLDMYETKTFHKDNKDKEKYEFFTDKYPEEYLSINKIFTKEEYDLFNDTYPEEFVKQVQNMYNNLISKYINSVEKIVNYVDNIEELGNEYKKHIKTYVKEQNDLWINKQDLENPARKF